MGADMFEATEPEARVAPDPDESDHALLLLMKRVGVDAGRVLWNDPTVEGGFPRAPARADFRL